MSHSLETVDCILHHYSADLDVMFGLGRNKSATAAKERKVHGTERGTIIVSGPLSYFHNRLEAKIEIEKQFRLVAQP